jgi:hypothetical protein
MTGSDLLGLVALVGFLVLMLAFFLLAGRWPTVFRPIKAFEDLGTAVERAVEAGERVHFSLGTGSIMGSDAAPALAGLAVLSRVAQATSMSDNPVVATSGDGAMAILAQDTLRSAYEMVGAKDRFQSISGRMLGPTPFSYVAGMPIVLATEEVSVHMLLGSFGAEGGLASDFGERQRSFVIAGTDDVQSQSLLYAVAGNPLIGEEIFAAGAYLNAGELHRASVRAQDVVRFVVIGAILLGTIARTIGSLL